MGYGARMTTATTTSFGGLHIRYDDRVLTPRAWTEAQSRWAADLAQAAPDGAALELCTGAGHIGLLLAALSDRRVVAVDVDPVAGELASANAAAAGLADRFEVRVGPMDEVLDPHERFGLVVADPPWVTRSATGRYPDDPVLAIDGGDDGLDVARTCLAVADRHLLPGGSLLLQLGTGDQADALGPALPARLERRELRTFPRGVLVHLRAE